MGEVADQQVLGGECVKVVDQGCCLDEVVLIRALNAAGVDEAADELEQIP